MDAYRITLTLEGFANDDGHVPLSAFVHEVQALVSLISRVDLLVSAGHQTVRARVVDLSHSSPAAMTVDLVARNAAVETRPRIIEMLSHTKDIYDDVDTFGDSGRAVLLALQELTIPIGKGIKKAALSFGQESIELDKALGHRIGIALAPEETSSGTIEGRLEAINIHDEANIFYVYPAIGPTRIKGRFPTALREKAVSAVDRNVVLAGTLKYKMKAPFPHEIEVEEFEVLPPDSDLPTMESLLGIAPDSTDGMPSELFVRQIRDDWQ